MSQPGGEERRRGRAGAGGAEGGEDPWKQTWSYSEEKGVIFIPISIVLKCEGKIDAIMVF